MKILLLNTSDADGGAARASYRLHTGLKVAGIDSQMLVQYKKSSDPSVIGPQWMKGEAMHKLRCLLDALPLRVYPPSPDGLFSPAWLPSNIARKIAAINPDIVHLHWICAGFVPVSSLARIDRPIVWTLHDSWPFTGGCHVPFDCLRYREACGACPQLDSNVESDLSRWVWKKKARILNVNKITIVTPSRWLAECARKSSLFRNMRIEVIPNGIDLMQFKPMDKRCAREFLNLPRDRKLIAFGALSATSDRNKGFHHLQKALQSMARQGWDEKAALLVFGADEPDNPPDMGIPARYIGRLHDNVSLALYYAAADVFVAPSIQENLSCTVMEALACGTPCVAFNIGGMPDLIEHLRTGYLAAPFDTENLAQGISWVLGDTEQWRALSRQSRDKVVDEFSLDKVTMRYRNLYQGLMVV